MRLGSYIFASKRESRGELKLSRIERCPRQSKVCIRRRWDEQSRSDWRGGQRPPRNRDSSVRAGHGLRALLNSPGHGIVVMPWNASAKHG
jgi:hypothetical protein